MSTKPEITFDEFLEIEKKLEIRIGIIVEAERIPKSKKLLKLTVSFEPRVITPFADTITVVTNIGDKFTPEDLLFNILPFITNLAPVTMMGIVSQGMIMIPEHKDGGLTIDMEETKKLIGSKLL